MRKARNYKKPLLLMAILAKIKSAKKQNFQSYLTHRIDESLKSLLDLKKPIVACSEKVVSSQSSTRQNTLQSVFSFEVNMKNKIEYLNDKEVAIYLSQNQQIETPKEAAIAYNDAAIEHFGEFASLNKLEDIKS